MIIEIISTTNSTNPISTKNWHFIFAIIYIQNLKITYSYHGQEQIKNPNKSRKV